MVGDGINDALQTERVCRCYRGNYTHNWKGKSDRLQTLAYWRVLIKSSKTLTFGSHVDFHSCLANCLDAFTNKVKRRLPSGKGWINSLEESGEKGLLLQFAQQGIDIVFWSQPDHDIKLLHFDIKGDCCICRKREVFTLPQLFRTASARTARPPRSSARTGLGIFLALLPLKFPVRVLANPSSIRAQSAFCARTHVASARNCTEFRVFTVAMYLLH
jgi:hypothetical protein